ncbi:MAG: hypothetical protein JXB26_19300 [Candidatus Aminicenantes bacterium]|nr:hypothetical protein [Candidatus Aminicenantes bacterium]
MSDPNILAKYSFLPWLRQGIANNIKTNPAAGTIRASIKVKLNVKTDTGLAQDLETSIQLIGPGDIIGISQDAIIRAEPRNWITDFEPNYLPFIEFYDEDFPWRYSPMPSDSVKHRITPWITLAALKETEFTDSKALSGPLPFFETEDDAAQVFPPSSQLWAWAHVHVNSNLVENEAGDSLNVNQSVNELENLLESNPDIAYSRLMVPRRLEPKTGYHCFLIPSFESGRRAGLGLDIGNTEALDYAWGNGQKRFPYYYRWYFHTSERGDFEYLVRLLEARPVDKRVGIRDMDVSSPGGGIDGIDMGEGKPKIIGMEGALKSPETESTDWPKEYPEIFQKQLADYINKADDYQKANPDTDPVITPPLYARWHALRERLSLDKDPGENPYDPQRKWVTELNLDPRNRASSGLGTRVVQDNQEEYMNKAWEQIGQVLEANRRLRLAQFAEAASICTYNKHIQNLNKNIAFTMTQPVHQRILGSSQTIRQKVLQSSLPSAVLSPEFRRIIRPRGPISRKIMPEARRRYVKDLLAQIAKGKLKAAPDKKVPDNLVSLSKASDKLIPSRIPQWLRNLLKYKWVQWILFGLLLILVILFLFLKAAGVLWGGLSVLGAIIIALTVALNRWTKAVDAGQTIKEENLTPEAVDNLPKSPSFRITEPGESVRFSLGRSDSNEARKFKDASRDLFTLIVDKPLITKAKPELSINDCYQPLIKALDPKVSIFNRVMGTLLIPPVIRARIPDRIVPVMAYPEFPQPMYEPLRDIDKEFLMPNIGLVPQNTISLLITNQKFIESYMVGLNHEMGRELLWREYPTDQRGSYFRQFWDVRDFVNEDPTLSEKELSEKLKDIPKVHTWLSTTALGSHNHRDPGGDAYQLVLLIRGDLLKRYPNTVIYAHKAEWDKDENGNILKEKPRKLASVTNEEERKVNQKYPLYSAKVGPDIFFLGFDLTIEDVKGQNEDDPGWFFVLKERVGEPRFGLDLEDEEVDVSLSEWDDLSWGDIKEDFAPGNHIKLTDDKNKIKPDNPGGIEWHSDSNAADMAFILFQDPVLVAVHGQEMLKA